MSSAPTAGSPRAGAAPLATPLVEHPTAARRRTVAGRLLATYVVVLAAFAVTLGWSVLALREASRDAQLLRAGYVPLLLRIGEALAEQNVFNAQLNHITAAKNPGDVRDWLDVALRTRPITFSQVEAAADALGRIHPSVERFAGEIGADARDVERALGGDRETFAGLYQALQTGNADAAEKTREDLARREVEGAARLRAMKARVEDRMERLTGDAKHREQRSMLLLVALAALTLLVGVGTSVYARRVLAPLTTVTDRANAVARGDFTPREIVATNDEIGELATTFEAMVAAIQRARAELVHAERLATIGKMAAHITHEIRNPLSAIGLNVELLEEEVTRGGDKEAVQLVGAVKAEVERLARISEQYLSVARRPRPNLERERVDDLVRELLAFLEPELRRANVTARIEIDDELPDAMLDEAQLRQALLNLVRNAREAMAAGGELVVSARRAVGGGVDVCVDDTGAGIPEDVRASVFDPFFTTKSRGTGLGLAVTREIVEAHGGLVACEPREGGGTRFRIHLPEAK